MQEEKEAEFQLSCCGTFFQQMKDLTKSSPSSKADERVTTL